MALSAGHSLPRRAGSLLSSSAPLSMALLLGVAACDGSDPKSGNCNFVAGDIVISEVMTDPEGDESTGEWIEIYNATNATVSLNKMIVAVAGSGEPKTHEIGGVPELAAHAYFVLANGPKSLAYVDYSYGGDFDLTNGGGTITLSCNGVTVDEVRYGSAAGRPQPEPAHSLGFDGGTAPDAVLNDNPVMWCADTASYDAGANFGSPGEPNVACGSAACTAGDLTRPVVTPAVGDVIINEVFADPTGTDTGKEWIELYVAGASTIDLNGLSLEMESLETGAVKRADITPLTCAAFAPGELAVVGQSDDSTVNGGVPVDIVVSDLEIGSGAMWLRLVRGDGTPIDVANVPAAIEGVSIRLDEASQSAAGNNDAEAFCASTQTGFFEGTGTPGAENGLCGIYTCDDGGTIRDVIPPAGGDLIITELFADPMGADTGKEWIELYVAAAQPVDLNGTVLVVSNAEGELVKSFTLLAEACTRGAPGDYLVVAANSDPAANGGVAVDLTLAALTFSNGAPLVLELSRGDTVIDVAAVPASIEGASVSLDGGRLSAAGNDDDAAFCSSRPSGHFEGLGTPGAPNGLCGTLTCYAQGSVRDVVRPGVGGVIVSELYANPVGPDTSKEWIELYMTAPGAADLNGLVIELASTTSSTVSRFTIADESCLTSAPGAYVLIGSAAADNGGITTTTIIPTLSISNDASLRVRILDGDTVIDEAELPAGREGVSVRLDDSRRTATGNDGVDAYCDGKAPSLFAGLGTPGTANGLCGTFACQDGGSIRDSVVPAAGDLIINELFANPAGSEGGKEWLELYVAYPGTAGALAPFDLNGLVLRVVNTATGSETRFVIGADACVGVANGDYVVVGASADTTVNGGVNVDVVVPGLSFPDAELTLTLERGATTVDTATIPAMRDGISARLDEATRTAAGNDSPTAFCPSTQVSAAGVGTPGASNGLCGIYTCRDGGGTIRDVVPPANGDLIITEVLADALGADGGNEWLEVYATAPVDLNGLTLEVRNPTTGDVTSTFLFLSEDCVPVAAGAYAVMGASLNAAENGNAPVRIVAPGLTLPNSNPMLLGLARFADVVDIASVPVGRDGVSVRLDGGRTTVAGNDTPLSFCLSSQSGNYVGLGTPGTANALCGTFTCYDGATIRDVDRPAAGGVVISEVFGNPAGTEDGKEWVELYVNSVTPVDLNGLTLSIETLSSGNTVSYTIAQQSCLTAVQGDYVVVAASLDPLANGHLPADTAIAGFTITNAAVAVRVLDGETLIDRVELPVAKEGVSLRLEGTRLDATDNDLPSSFCDGVISGKFDNGLGTPGEPNGLCGTFTCLDGGTARDTLAPLPGEVIVNEINAGPTGMEWIELYVPNGGFDMNGLLLQLTHGGKAYAVASESCIEATANSYWVIAANGDQATNGHVPVNVVVPTLSIPDSALAVTVLSFDGTIIDEAALPAAVLSVSMRLDQVRQTAAGNDTALSFCRSTQSGNFDGLGTPGAANSVCGTFGCLAGATPRESVSPAVGDLVVNEVYARPSGTSPTPKRWLELYAAAGGFDLNGLTLRVTNGATVNRYVIATASCLPVIAGEYWVLGASNVLADNGNVPVDVVIPGFTLADAELDIRVELADGTIIDDAVVPPTPKAGVSMRLDQARLSALDNDLFGSYCPSVQTGAYDPRGTPKAANGMCGIYTCRDVAVTRDVVPPQANELLITEVLAQAAGADAGKEWLEVYATAPVDLNGLTVEVRNTSGAVQGSYLFLSEDCVRVGPGAYATMGASTNTANNGNAPVRIAALDLSMPDDKSLVLDLLRGAQLIDETTVPAGQDGVSVRLDGGRMTPTGNDTPLSFCLSDQSGHYSGLGTPGLANALCGTFTCDDTGTVRDVVRPIAGEVVISEVMGDPSDPEAGKEWIEIYVDSATPVDLNGLTIDVKKVSSASATPYTIADQRCLMATQGDYVVIAASLNTSVNGNVLADTAIPGFTIPNPSNAELVNGLAVDIKVLDGTALLDAVQLPQAKNGASLRLDDTRLDDAANDLPGSFCNSTVAWDLNDLGTPGQPNGLCGTFACLDQDTGQPRPSVAPTASGAVVMSEVFADPVGGVTTESAKEWFELYAPIGGFDLNGLLVQFTPIGAAQVLANEDCLEAQPDTYWVFAGSNVPANNGNVPADAVVPGLTIDNVALDISVKVTDGTLIDAASIPAAPADKGISMRLDGTRMSAVDNDLPGSYCDSTQTGYFSGNGTPGLANGICGTFDCLDGTTPRLVVPPGPGDLRVTEVFADATGVDDNKEWIELLVTAAQGLDLNQVLLTFNNGSPLLLRSDTCLHVDAGQYVVIGATKVTADNGNVPVTIAVPGFAIAGGTLTVNVSREGTVIDTASVPAAVEGRAQSLDPSTTDNDTASNFCTTNTTRHFDEKGTPGGPNLCGLVCWDGATERNMVRPAAGELVISEVMSNPKGTDNANDWLEFYLVPQHSVDLNGLRVTQGTSHFTLTAAPADACVKADPATVTYRYFVVGGANVAADGVSAIATVSGTGTMMSSSGTLQLELDAGATIIDTATPFSVSTVDGRSYTLDPDLVDATANDTSVNWCLSTPSFGSTGNLGTPGLPNYDQCN